MKGLAAWQRRFLEEPAWQNVGLALILLTAGLLLTAFGEHIPLGDGLGYDGSEYGRWAMHWDAVVDGRIPVSAYRIFRMLPSFLAHGVLRLAGAPLTPGNVILFFEIYNLLLLCLAALAWGGIADALSLGGQGKFLGFIGLFCNHAVLKFDLYYPVLTDVSGYACAVFLLWAFVRARIWLTALVTVAGMFCWPPLLVYGAVVLLFPRRDQLPQAPSRPAGIWAGILAAGGYGILAAHPLTGLTPHYPLAAAVVMLYLGLSAYLLFASPYRVWAMLRRATTPGRLIVFAGAAALAVLAWLTLGRVVAHPGDGGFFNLSPWRMALAYLRTTCVPLSVRFPGEFLVAHVLYFGPLLLLTGLFPARTAAAAGRLGLGFFLLIVVAVGHAIMPLSRQWLAGYPVLALATVWALRDVPLSRGIPGGFYRTVVVSFQGLDAFQPDPTGRRDRLRPRQGPGLDAGRFVRALCVEHRPLDVF